MPLEAYVGNAVVVDLTKLFAGRKDEIDRTRQIGVADLEAFSASFEQAPRLLLKTGVWNDSKVFPDWIPVIAREVPDWLAERKVKLLGLDLPSVDPIEAKKLTNHHALAAARIAIVESLDLSEVEAGIYHLSALPLKIAGGDAGPGSRNSLAGLISEGRAPHVRDGCAGNQIMGLAEASPSEQESSFTVTDILNRRATLWFAVALMIGSVERRKSPMASG